MRMILQGLFFLLLSISVDLNAQEITGNWIKTKVTYLDNLELTDDNPIKYQYLRYTFEKNNKFFMSVIYDDKGKPMYFRNNTNILHIKNPYGHVINSFQINKITEDELVLVEKGENGFNDENCLKYYFVKERVYQNQLKLKPSDIISIYNDDTVYSSTEKIHAKFLGDKSFFDFCLESIPESNAVMSTNNLFFATFIVRKSGGIDSVQILENINKRFEKQFLKALDKSKKLWEPADVDGRKVDVQMKIVFRFLSSDKFLPMYNFSQKGKDALDNQDYMKALSYFKLALDKVPSDTELLYYKAICEINLGNKEAACEDLAKVKVTRKLQVDELIEKNCK